MAATSVLRVGALLVARGHDLWSAVRHTRFCRHVLHAVIVTACAHVGTCLRAHSFGVSPVHSSALGDMGGESRSDDLDELRRQVDALRQLVCSVGPMGHDVT